MVCFTLLALIAVGQGFYGEGLRQRLRLAEQLAAQQAEEAKAYSEALETALSQRGTQLSALQNLAQGCEQSRVQDAADAEARQAILGNAPEQKPATAPQTSRKERTHDSTRAAVANRLNRPL